MGYRVPALCGWVVMLAGCGGTSTTFTTTNEPLLPATLPAAPAGAALADAGRFQSEAIVVGTFEVAQRTAVGSNVFDTADDTSGRVAAIYSHQTQEFVFTPLSEPVVDKGEASAFFGRDISGYDHVTVLSQILDLPAGTQFDNDTRVSGLQVAGLPTPRNLMPTLGTTTMFGDGYVSLPGVSWRADTVADVDFDNSQVTLEIRAEAPTAGEADTLRLSNMRISNDRFFGGALSLQSAGVVVTPIGAIQSRQIEGQFFGTTGPDEAGGQILATGAAGELRAMFLLD